MQRGDAVILGSVFSPLQGFQNAKIARLENHPDAAINLFIDYSITPESANDTTNENGASITYGSNNIFADPLFIATPNGPAGLSDLSPAISSSFITTEVNGITYAAPSKDIQEFRDPILRELLQTWVHLKVIKE